MQKEEEIITSSSEMMTMDPWSLFLYGMKAPMTREKYNGRLVKFFDFIGLTGVTMRIAPRPLQRKAKDNQTGYF